MANSTTRRDVAGAMLPSPRRMSSAITRLYGDERGTIAVVVALCAPLIFGFAALATDVASWQVAQKSMQGAADAAAYSAGIAQKNADGTSIVTQAKAMAASQGFVDGVNGVSVTVNRPPSSGNYTGTATAIEVIIQQPQPRFLSGLFLSSDPTVRARGVATIGSPGGSACMLALDPSANQAINVSGSGSIHAPNCYIVSDSSSSTSINMSGSATINSACLVAVGTVQTTSGLTENNCTTPKIHSAAVHDPYASVPEPTAPGGACLTVPSGTSITLSPGNYCSGLSVSGSSTTATFQPGLYYVNGNYSIQGGATATGSGVTFYIRGGNNVAISGGSTVTFSAPTTGATAGIVYFGDRTTTHGNNNFSGGSGAGLTGAVYFATQQVSYTGGTGTANGCTQLIADTIIISGNSSFSTNGCAGTGVSTISVPGVSSGTVGMVE